jgi:hypothetical protein
MQKIISPYINNKITIKERSLLLSSVKDGINSSKYISDIDDKKNIYHVIDNICFNSGISNAEFGDILTKRSIESIETIFPAYTNFSSVRLLIQICEKNIQNNLMHGLFELPKQNILKYYSGKHNHTLYVSCELNNNCIFMYTPTHAQLNPMTKDINFFLSELDTRGKKQTQFVASTVDVIYPVFDTEAKNSICRIEKNGITFVIHMNVMSKSEWKQLLLKVHNDIAVIGNKHIYPINPSFHYQLSILVDGSSNDFILRNLVNKELYEKSLFYMKDPSKLE